MPDPGDSLLFALSAWGETGWARFKSAYDAVRPVPAEPEAAEEERRRERWGAARLLASLGHCDVLAEGGRLRVVAAPPVLAPLPVPGLPRAVLCGSRSPRTVPELRDACRGLGTAVQVRSQAARASFAPSWIGVETDSRGELEKVGKAAGIPVPETPPAWALAEAAGSVTGYVESLQWVSAPELSRERQDFDVTSLRFGGCGTREAGLRLSRYRDPVRMRWVYRLWRGGLSAEADPSWARYAVLAACGKRVLAYDELACTLTVPLGAPLPVLLARALALCTGMAPRIDESARCEVYERVPPDVAEEVARKAGQPQRQDVKGERR